MDNELNHNKTEATLMTMKEQFENQYMADLMQGLNEAVTRLEVGKLDDYVLLTIKGAIDKINRKLNSAELELLGDVLGELKRRRVNESINEDRYDSPEQAKLAAATANFKNAIIAVDADEMLRTYKDIESIFFTNLFCI